MISAVSTICVLLAFLPRITVDESPVLLDEYAPCGQASLYLVCRLRSVDASFRQVEQLTGPADEEGCHSFATLSRAAEQMGLPVLAVHVDRTWLMDLPLPAIAHFENPIGERRPHLLVLLNTSPEGVHVLDAPSEPRLVPWSLFEHFWTGNLLVFPSTKDEMVALQSRLSDPWHVRISFWLIVIDIAAIIAIGGWFGLRWRGRGRAASDRVASAIRVSPAKASAIGTRDFYRGWHRFRKRAVVYGGLALGIGAAAVVFEYPASSELFSRAPRLNVEQPVVDLGEFAPGEHQTTILLRNDGRSPLLISKIESSCSCAVVSKPADIDPHANGQMKVRFHVSSGRGYANLAIHSNDPSGLRDVTLTWHGSAQPMLLPRQIAGKDTPVGNVFERTVSIVYPGGRAAVVPDLETVECEAGNVHVDVLDNNPTAFRTASVLSEAFTIGYLNLRVRVDSPAEPNGVKTSVVMTVKYGHEVYKLKLPISVRFIGPVTAEPNSIAFTAITPTELQKQRRSIALVSSNVVGELKVGRCPDWLRCEVLHEHGRGSELCMVVSEPPPTQFVADTIELNSVNDPDLNVPISVSAFAKTQERSTSGN